MSTHEAAAEGVFTPEMIAAVNRAYERALRSIGGSKTTVDQRAALAKHVMAVARAGVRDEQLLRLLALAAFHAKEAPGTREDEGEGAHPGAASPSVPIVYQ